MKRRVIVIGGGASGLVAGIFAARNGAAVTIVEHMDRVGKKLLSTGNGRCNMTNLALDASCYRCGRQEFPMEVIRRFPVEHTLAFFKELGIIPKNRSGYIYPNSDQAASVLDALRYEISRLGVEVCLGCHGLGLRFETTEASLGQTGNAPAAVRVEVRAEAEKPGQGDAKGKGGTRFLTCDAVVLACGSKAAPSTGSDGSGYELAASLGHRIIKPLPALVQLRCQGSHYRQMAGVRTEARIRLLVDGKEAARDQGELQLTDYGISGIPVFQISRFASRALDQGKRVEAVIDYLPAWTQEETRRELKRRTKRLGDRPAQEFLSGMLNRKLAQVLVRSSGIRLSDPAAGLTAGQIDHLTRQIKSYRAMVSSVNPFASAQVCCGGVDTREVDGRTMESKKVKGVYFAGELLDVDGICGGYNLQFAWSSGALAGAAAAGEAALDTAAPALAGTAEGRKAE